MSLFFLAGAIMSTAIAQVSYKLFFHENKKVYLVLAVSFFIMTPFLAFFALKSLSLSFVYMSTGLTYVLVILAAKIILNEEISRRQVYAVALIVAGVAAFNF